MKNSNTHIISTIGWNTSFDSKTEAVALQEKLSAWSKFQLPRHISRVFDSICPPDQTWIINRLEIDLEQIDYHDLEDMLAQRLTEKLREKMRDIAFKSGSAASNNELKIIERNSTGFQLVTGFLLTGFMQWNYDRDMGSVDQLLQFQLLHNRQNTIAIIKELGAADRNVRKRIAWQVSEPVIQDIVEGLEPGNHWEIFRFTRQLTQLQVQTNIVKTNAAGFSRNLWLWVLDYLLEERGSFFNRQAFIKSNLRQMAAHYNIGYNALLKLVEQAIELATAKANVKSDFISVLKSIAEENKIHDNQSIKNAADTRAVLTGMFNDPVVRKTSAGKKIFNEMLVRYCHEYRSGFLSLVESVQHKDQVWAAVEKDLTNTSMEVLLASLIPARAAELTQVVHFLHKTAAMHNRTVNIKMLWKSGLQFIRKQGNAAFTTAAFIHHCITGISIATATNAAQWYAMLAFSGMPTSMHTPVSIELYEKLSDAGFAALKSLDGSAAEWQLRNMLEHFTHSSAALVKHKTFECLKNMLHRSFRFNPGLLLNTLSACENKALMNKIILHGLNDNEIRILLEKAGQEKGFLVLSFAAMLEKAVANGNARFTRQFTKEKLQQQGLRIILLYPRLSVKQTFRRLIRESGVQCSADELLVVEQIIHGTGESHEIAGGSFRTNTGFNDAAVLRLISLRADAQPYLTQYLLQHFNETGCRNFRGANNEGSRKVLDYLLKDGNALMLLLVKKYTALLQYEGINDQAATRQQLHELYWQVLLHAAPGSCNKEQVRLAFALAFVARFPLRHKRLLERMNAVIISGSPQRFKPGNSLSIAADDLSAIIEAGIKNGSTMVEYHGKKIELATLIAIALKTDQGLLRKIIRRNGSLRQIANIIRPLLSFEQFSFLIIQDLPGESNSAIRELRIFYQLVAALFPGTINTALADYCWTVALHIVNGRSVSVTHIKKMAAGTFARLALRHAVKATDVAEQIRNMDIPDGSAMYGVLTTAMPGLTTVLNAKEIAAPSYILREMDRKGIINELFSFLLVNKQVPFWLKYNNSLSEKELIREIVLHYPGNALLVMRKHDITTAQTEWLSQTLNFNVFTQAICKYENEKQSQLNILKEFYWALGKINLPGITSAQLQQLLFKKIINAWNSNNWKIISTGNIWNELMWELQLHHGMSTNNFIDGISKASALLPASLQITFKFLESRYRNPLKNIMMKNEMSQQKNTSTRLATPGFTGKAGEGIPVKNAGIVLLNSYLPILFDRLQLIENSQFKNTEGQASAVHYVQYIITGLTQTEEYLLPLNKLLCGLPLSTPVKNGIEITEADKALINGLVQAAINYWPAIGQNSVAGFRGNWLVRDGLLVELEDKWQLTIEKRAYDILLNKSPFSFSIIKYPWMKKPLHVTWPY
ncbi:contractile injection system tape measure protein [Ferruginibacter profundus]